MNDAQKILPAYSEYKESSQVWLGKVPHHWRMLRNKYAATYAKGRNPKALFFDSSEGLVPYLSMDYLRGNSAAQNSGIERGSVVVKDGQTLVIWDGSNAGEFVKGKDGILSSTMALAKVSPEFDHNYYWFASKSYEHELRRTAVGMGIPHVDGDELKNIVLPLPAFSEQKQIALFLDYETAKIDALIEKQQQLIALLGEKRQAVISHAVTKGLNPDAPMRDSGVEWLGEVPEHWTVCRLKHAFSFLTSGPRGWSDLITDNGASVFLQSGDLNDELGLRLDTAKRITPPRNAEGVRTKMQDGDVVCCVTGANTGRVAVAAQLNQTVFVNQHLALIRPRLDLAHPRFLATLLSATPTRTYFAVKQYGLKEGLSLTNVAETPICLPPISEQEDIVNYLDVTESKMRRLREIADDQVELLQERRTALISAAVTGKIDVRGWKRPSAAPKKETEMEVA